MKISIALLTSVLFVTLQAHGSTPAFTNLSQSDVDDIEREMSANTNLHDLMPPSPLGSVWGFEVGIAGGAVNSPNMNRLVQEASPDTTLKQLPHADVVGAVTLPLALTVEASYLPKISVSGANYQEYAGALKWTPSAVWDWPLNVAVRGFYSHSDFSFAQTLTDPTLGPVNVNVTNATSVSGIQAIASPKLWLIEPYVGLGWLRGAGNLNLDGNTTSTIFNYTNAKSASSSSDSTQLLVGIDFRVLIFGAGLEWSRAFGTDSYSAKLSLKF